MRKYILSIVFSIPIIVMAQAQKPKLVVGIVVDQMRYDYLTRFWDRYGDGGFKKLVKEGYNCKNANYNYMPTYTGPGHASIYTGTTPENHGIISNSWYDKVSKVNVYCTGDGNVNTVGSASTHGQMSPKRMLGTTITDELKIATNQKGKVIGMSIKDRGAILPAGHKADAAYWFDGGDAGAWISSTFYMKELPEWVRKVNAAKMSDKFLNGSWETMYPIDTYTASIADNNEYEEVFTGEETPTFPHKLSELRAGNFNHSLIKGTPFGNTILKELALAAIKGERLGKDEFTDFLAISFSSTDYVGHMYGPMSVEIEDTYLRLDKDLEEILNYLAKNFKKEEVLIFLTADHGAVNVPQYLIDNHIPAGYFDNLKLTKDLKTYLYNEYNSDSLVANISNYQVFLNHDYIRKKNWNLTAIENTIGQYLLTQHGIAKIVTASSLKATEFKDGIIAITQRGFHQARSGDVLYVLESGWIPKGTSPKGTTHGSPYNYDTHVPLLWYGGGISHGETEEFIVIPDIAATLGSLMRIERPSSCTGKPIQGVLK